MSEKEKYLQTRAQELQVTKKVLRACPLDKPEFRPRQNMPSARDLVLDFVKGEFVSKGIIGDRMGRPDLSVFQTSSLPEIIALYENLHNEVTEQIKRLPLEAFDQGIDFFGKPVRRGDAFWLMLHSAIHHRGQLFVYANLAGGSVPQLYGED